MTEKELLEEQIRKLDNIQLSNINNWRSETLPIISEIFPQKSSQYEQFIHIGWGSMDGYKQRHIYEYKNCLNGMIKCLEIRKANNSKSQNSNGTGIIINNNPSFSQSQTQNQTFNVEDIIKDELPPSKLKEIKDIVSSDESKESKLEKIGNVLRKTGIEVVSSTLAKVITMGIF